MDQKKNQKYLIFIFVFSFFIFFIIIIIFVLVYIAFVVVVRFFTMNLFSEGSRVKRRICQESQNFKSVRYLDLIF